MTGISCFPIAVQLPQNEFQSAGAHSPDDSLVVELVSLVATLFKKEQPSELPLQFMSEDSKIQLAQDGRTSATRLSQLAADNNAVVRNAVVFHPTLPLASLMQLTRDSDRFIAGQARARLASLQQFRAA